MSFSVGHLHWIVPLSIALFLIYTTLFLPPKLGGRIKERGIFWLCAALGLLAIFLTHGKSEIIWRLLPPLSFIQFPWRFLTFSTFFLSLVSGAIALIISKKLIPPLLLFLFLLNAGFFRPDIWRSISDVQQFSGPLWDEQRSSALQDFWPKSAPKLPVDFAFPSPRILLETAEYQKFSIPLSTSPAGNPKWISSPSARWD